MIVDTFLFIPRRHPPELLEAVDQAFHHIPQPIDRTVKATSSLICFVWDRHPHPASSQVLPNLAAAVALVAHHPTRSQARAASTPSLDRPLLHQLLKGRRLMTLAGREHKGHRLSVALGPDMHFGAEATLRAPKSLTLCVASLGSGCMLVGSNDGAIHRMDLPVEQASLISLLLQSIEDALPEALLTPAIEAAGERGPGARALRDIAPGSAGAVKPEQTIDDAAMAKEGSAALASLRRTFGWQERLKSFILSICQVMSIHNLAVYRVCEQTLVLLARDRGEVPLRFQLLIYPMLDDRTVVTPEPHPYTGEWVWTPAQNHWGWSAWLDQEPGGSDVSPYAAPARASDLQDLPPTFISVGSLDLFVEENMEYARRLIRAGVPTELHVYPGAFHGFPRVVDAQVTRACTHDWTNAVLRATTDHRPPEMAGYGPPN